MPLYFNDTNSTTQAKTTSGSGGEVHHPTVLCSVNLSQPSGLVNSTSAGLGIGLGLEIGLELGIG